MICPDTELVSLEKHSLDSRILGRKMPVDAYLPQNNDIITHVLLINDGQDLRPMAFEKLLSGFISSNPGIGLLCLAIHSNTERKSEYGIAGFPDYKGRGVRAGLFSRFVIEELIPFAEKHYSGNVETVKCYAGFSLGGLSAFDMVWNHPDVFHAAGVFSGALWWRDKSMDDPDFDERRHRIMHNRVRAGNYHPGMRFFFEAGAMDETADRNKNGIIDSIDDTLDLISELKLKGCPDDHMCYLELPEGRHDTATWAEAFPSFLQWCFAK